MYLFSNKSFPIHTQLSFKYFFSARFIDNSCNFITINFLSRTTHHRQRFWFSYFFRCLFIKKNYFLFNLEKWSQRVESYRWCTRAPNYSLRRTNFRAPKNLIYEALIVTFDKITIKICRNMRMNSSPYT